MALFTRASSHPNTTDPVPCGANSTTEPELPHSHAYYALCYCILILAIIFGNVLVCLAVLRERTLQTTTNYLVVSLAVADLLVATLVMPWMVYLEVTGGVWTFSRICCDIFVTMDVMMCTASILNLCAISIDRYTAVVKPVQYQYSTGQSSCRRVSLMIVIVWMLAFAVSCPLLFGFNTTGTHGEESFAKQMPRHVFPLSLAQMHRPGDVYKKEVADCLQPAALPKLLPRGIPHQGTRDYPKQQVGREEEHEASSGGSEAQQWWNHQQLEAGTAAAPTDPAAGEEGYTDAGNCPGDIHSLLAALLLDSHPQRPLPILPRASGALQCQHLARIRQQRPQPHHLHNFQH
ncbi:D(3) dopamine receptor isoform X2 [Cyanistes caeruleus]|uniref:D(3) dopamine receptor isoform X2 n=1 Tax=Cyanistes caeruleus TaxID=156563 RepID=UPI000CDA7478|nr:D(3) dopamine receptor isoform X2 [Cyanistes caeruleus]